MDGDTKIYILADRECEEEFIEDLSLTGYPIIQIDGFRHTELITGAVNSDTPLRVVIKNRNGLKYRDIPQELKHLNPTIVAISASEAGKFFEDKNYFNLFEMDISGKLGCSRDEGYVTFSINRTEYVLLMVDREDILYGRVRDIAFQEADMTVLFNRNIPKNPNYFTSFKSFTLWDAVVRKAVVFTAECLYMFEDLEFCLRCIDPVLHHRLNRDEGFSSVFCPAETKWKDLPVYLKVVPGITVFARKEDVDLFFEAFPCKITLTEWNDFAAVKMPPLLP